MSTVKSHLRDVKHNPTLREELRTRINRFFDVPLAVASMLTAPLANCRRRRIGQLLLISLLVILVAATVEYPVQKNAPGSEMTIVGAALW